MDAYEYINSKDIRTYLAKQSYAFTPVQYTFLVWQSKRHMLEQKHKAWNDIINTLPDCDVPERINCKGLGLPSFHAAKVHGFGAKVPLLLSFG